METETDPKDAKELKHKLKVVKVQNPCYIVLLVVHRETARNDVSRLSCKRLLPIEGYPTCMKIIPVGGYVYDGVNDCYLVNCIDYLPLGFLPFFFKIEMEGVGHWSASSPMPESLLRRHLPSLQRSDLDKFKSTYSSEEFKHQYIQFISTC